MFVRNRNLFFSPEAGAGDPPVTPENPETPAGDPPVVQDPPAKPAKPAKTPKAPAVPAGDPPAGEPPANPEHEKALLAAEARAVAAAEKLAAAEKQLATHETENKQYREYLGNVATEKLAAAPQWVRGKVTIDPANPMAAITRIAELTELYHEASTAGSASAPPPAGGKSAAVPPGTISDAPVPMPRTRFKK